MLINVFGKWINPFHITDLRKSYCVSTSCEAMHIDDILYAWETETPDQVANEINRQLALPIQNHTTQPSETYKKLVSITQSLIINQQNFKPEEAYANAFDKLVNFAKETLKEAQNEFPN